MDKKKNHIKYILHYLLVKETMQISLIKNALILKWYFLWKAQSTEQTPFTKVSLLVLILQPNRLNNADNNNNTDAAEILTTYRCHQKPTSHPHNQYAPLFAKLISTYHNH